MLPVRCYTCGKVLSHLQNQWETHQKEHPNDWSPFFSIYSIRRYCCRRVLMGHVPDKNQEHLHILPESVVLAEESDKIVRFYLAR